MPYEILLSLWLASVCSVVIVGIRLACLSYLNVMICLSSIPVPVHLALLCFGGNACVMDTIAKLIR